MLLWMPRTVRGTPVLARGALLRLKEPLDASLAGVEATYAPWCSMHQAATRKRRRGRSESGSSNQPKRSKASSSALQPGENHLSEGTWVAFHPAALKANSQEIADLLQEEVPWQQQEITVMGRKVMQPRLVAYMAEDPSLSYTYSRTKQTPLPWTPTVALIKAEVEKLAGTVFNSCLLNMYRNGSDSLSWHSDNEPVYGSTPVIGSASFGAPRDFLLRRNSDRSQRFHAALGDGDVLIMSGNCQRDWQHSVPKRAGCDQDRINLTFRTVLERKKL